jgi:hypothetical protein
VVESTVGNRITSILNALNDSYSVLDAEPLIHRGHSNHIEMHDPSLLFVAAAGRSSDCAAGLAGSGVIVCEDDGSGSSGVSEESKPNSS